MTTDEQTATSDETQRSVGELLQCDTYQDMTDAEIQSLVNYWRAYGYSEGHVACESEHTTATQAELASAASAAYEASQKAFDAAIQTQVNFLVYDGSVATDGQEV